MKGAITALLTGGFVAASLFAVPMARAADAFTLSSPAVQDNGILATKNACSDKQRTPNCVGDDPAPLLPSLITRIRCDSGPVGTGLQTRLGPDRQGSCVAGRHCNRGARLR